MALQKGHRGLPGGSSLAQLLTEHRDVRNRMRLPRLTEEQILGWMHTHYARFGVWPNGASGAIHDAPGETWCAVDRALRSGHRGLHGGTSLVRVLAQQCNVTRLVLRPLRVEQILTWADALHDRTGCWPTQKSGAIVGAPGETWQAVELALRHGYRGLPGPSSLAQFLAKHRGTRNRGHLPRLTNQLILTWADHFYQQYGKWPSALDGSIGAAPGETWAGVNIALKLGYRGLPGGISWCRLLKKHRPVVKWPGHPAGFNPFAQAEETTGPRPKRSSRVAK